MWLHPPWYNSLAPSRALSISTPHLRYFISSSRRYMESRPRFRRSLGSLYVLVGSSGPSTCRHRLMASRWAWLMKRQHRRQNGSLPGMSNHGRQRRVSWECIELRPFSSVPGDVVQVLRSLRERGEFPNLTLEQAAKGRHVNFVVSTSSCLLMEAACPLDMASLDQSLGPYLQMSDK
jgi:hypothetical protein